MIYNLNLSEPWFSLVKSGIKIYEGRLFEKVRYYSIDDIIIISCNNPYKDPFKVKILNKYYYINFEEALKDLGISNILGKDYTLEESVQIYKDIYPIDKQLEKGIIMLELVITH
jgi:ASC-1-like (ASCH) protein